MHLRMPHAEDLSDVRGDLFKFISSVQILKNQALC